MAAMGMTAEDVTDADLPNTFRMDKKGEDRVGAFALGDGISGDIPASLQERILARTIDVLDVKIRAAIKNDRVGATAIMALHRPKSRVLHTAVCGDNVGIILHDGDRYSFTPRHELENPAEKAALKKRMEGTVCYLYDDYVTFGTVGVDAHGVEPLRSIGDGCFGAVIPAVAEVVTYENVKRFLLGSDGLSKKAGHPTENIGVVGSMRNEQLQDSFGAELGKGGKDLAQRCVKHSVNALFSWDDVTAVAGGDDCSGDADVLVWDFDGHGGEIVAAWCDHMAPDAYIYARLEVLSKVLEAGEAHEHYVAAHRAVEQILAKGMPDKATHAFKGHIQCIFETSTKVITEIAEAKAKVEAEAKAKAEALAKAKAEAEAKARAEEEAAKAQAEATAAAAQSDGTLTVYVSPLFEHIVNPDDPSICTGSSLDTCSP